MYSLPSDSTILVPRGRPPIFVDWASFSSPYFTYMTFGKLISSPSLFQTWCGGSISRRLRPLAPMLGRFGRFWFHLAQLVPQPGVLCGQGLFLLVEHGNVRGDISASGRTLQTEPFGEVAVPVHRVGGQKQGLNPVHNVALFIFNRPPVNGLLPRLEVHLFNRPCRTLCYCHFLVPFLLANIVLSCHH